MSTSVGVNVLRWSALGVGIFYGAYHQLSLSAADRAARARKEWDNKESLIRQAKQEWARLHPVERGSKDGKGDEGLNVLLGIAEE